MNMATSDAYSAVPRAQLTYDYLHTNSTTHEFLFGALAELVDNARDAASKRIDIYSEPAESYRGKYMLCFLDDGDGMDPDEVSNVIKFGRSDKRIIDKNMIGQYGNGLKSGTMRIAKDVILFTKKDNKVSCLLISRTFHEREKINEILIPMPSWDARSKTPLLRKHTNTRQHHQEVKIITDYSPFKTVDSLFAQFDKIKSTGTLVILYNLQLMDNGEPELDVGSAPDDILMADPSGETFDTYTMPERKSFRAYTAILYLDPKMKIYIQNKKVRTVRLTTSMYKPGTYTFTSKRFKCRLEREEKRAEQELKIAESKAHELEIQEREEREKSEGTLREALVGQRQAGVRLAEALTDVNFKKMILNNTRKALKDPQTLDFVFGINLNKRRCCGIMVYNCNRLIKMYEKVGCQIEGGIQGCGVLGVVNVPYLVLEPTHNKQDFADGKEYKSLTKALGEHLDDYWKNSPMAKQGVVRFWEAYGYNKPKWKDDPSMEEKFIRKRMMDLPLYVQCDKCLKWRELAFHSRYVQHEPDEHWCCKMNPDADCNNCQRPEKKPASISRHVLNKSKPQRITADTSRETRPSLAAESRSQAIRETNKRQSTPLNRQPTPPTRQPTPPKTYKAVERPIRPVPIQPKPVVATSSYSSRQKPQTNSTKQGERPAPSSSQTSSRHIKQEKSSRSKSQVSSKPGRPTADSTENKQDPKMKRPHPDNNNVDESQKESVKRRKSGVVSPSASASTTQATIELEVNNDMDWTDEREAVSSGSPKPTSSKSTDDDIVTLQGRACRAKTDDDVWHAGTIVCVKQARDGGVRAKVKFRDHMNDKYDKWYDHPGTSIRIEEPSDSGPSSPVNQTSPQPLPTSSSIELPSTTTSEPSASIDNGSSPTSPVASPDNTVSSIADREDSVQDLAGLARKLLEFFRPPNFTVTKEQLTSLSVQELRIFNAREFCDKYEEDLGTLMNDITTKARNAETRAEDLQTRHDEMSRQLAAKTEELQEESERLSEVTEQLISLRRKSCRLIGMLNDRENHIPEEDVENTLDNFITMLQNEAHLLNN